MSKEYDSEIEDFNEYLECDYIHKGGELYECPGGHIWHISDIIEEWERLLNEYNNTGGNL